MRLLLARHAHATTGPDHRVAAEDPLSELGRRQAEELAAYLAELDEPPDRIIASTAVRARETAEACAAALGCAEVEIDHRLCDHGSLNGQLPYTLAEQVEKLPMDDVWEPTDAAWDGETACDFWRRTAAAVKDVVDGSGSPLVVSHLGTVSAMVRWAFGIPEDSPDSIFVSVDNASLTELVFRIDRRGRRRVVLRRSGDVHFLSTVTHR